MANETDEVKIDAKNVTIVDSGNPQWQPDDDENGVDSLLAWVREIVTSPQFAEHVIPLWGTYLKNKHDEAMARTELEKLKLGSSERFNYRFLIARVIIGILLMGGVVTLTLMGRIATETTIVTFMVTLAAIIWGSKD